MGISYFGAVSDTRLFVTNPLYFLQLVITSYIRVLSIPMMKGLVTHVIHSILKFIEFDNLYKYIHFLSTMRIKVLIAM